MFSKPVAVALLAVACVTAAAGGAYVAVRQNQPSAPAAVAPDPSAAQTQAAGPAVRETEALVAPEPAPAGPPRRADVEEPKAFPADEPVETPAARRAERPRPPVDRTPPRTSPTRDASAQRSEPTPAPSARATTTPVAAEPPARPDAVASPEPMPVEAPPPAPAAPPARVFDELVVATSSVIGLQVETPVSSERARVEDRVEARVIRDVSVDGRTAIPSGARAIGTVTLVERGGKMKERARLGVRFHTLVLADGTELAMRTDSILREGESPGGESARKIGGAAVGGAILGAIIGGKKGAIVGGATGAAGGSAVVMAGDRNPATLPVGAVVTVRLTAPVTVEVERR